MIFMNFSTKWNKFRASKQAKTTFSELLDPQKIDYKQNLSDRTIPKFPHCEIIMYYLTNDLYLLANTALSGKVTFLSRELVFSRILIIFSIKTWLYLASALPFKVSSYKVVKPKLKVTFDENFWQVSINWWGGRGTDFGLIMPGKMSAFNHKSNVNFFWKFSENFVKLRK